MQTEEEMFDEAADETDTGALEVRPPEDDDRPKPAAKADEPTSKQEPKDEEEFDPRALAKAVAMLDANIKSKFRDIDGKFGGLSQQFTTFKTEVAAARTPVQTADEAPSKGQIAAASANSAKWNQLKDDFPEWADAIEERLSSLMPKQEAKPAKAETPAVEQKPVSDPRVDDMSLQLETMRTKEAHPDLKEIVDSDGWKVFMAGLPAQLQMLASSRKAEDAIFLLDHYKSSTTQKSSTQLAAERQGKLRNAVNPVRGQATPRRSVVSLDDMSEEQLFDYYAAQETAKGR